MKAEQKRSDRLVSQMLPTIVAENFKNNRQEEKKELEREREVRDRDREIDVAHHRGRELQE